MVPTDEFRFRRGHVKLHYTTTALWLAHLHFPAFLHWFSKYNVQISVNILNMHYYCIWSQYVCYYNEVFTSNLYKLSQSLDFNWHQSVCFCSRLHIKISPMWSLDYVHALQTRENILYFAVSSAQNHDFAAQKYAYFNYNCSFCALIVSSLKATVITVTVFMFDVTSLKSSVK